ncbi:hypothetical protein LTR78_000914 [Recurvomyces mirabilis]|uniref:Uncharacterized protein n=1 Tax=Recurvomyces mirabilis TaxID=574656 RepID=A0AAE0WWS8_9PEZI|nr:hypothetical protein LTR78_000914 [Recurvomyces mirabilis]KAK5158885.1 hypothetical protein LTS14_002993 [Recurvomyces mirabilis]
MALPQDPNVIAPDGDVTLTCGGQLVDGIPLLLREAAILLRHDRTVKSLSCKLVFRSTATSPLSPDLADFAAEIRQRIVVYIESQIDHQLAHPECTALPRCISLMLSRMKHVDLFPMTKNAKPISQLCTIMTNTSYTDPTETAFNQEPGCRKHNLHSLRHLQGQFAKEANAIRASILNMNATT